MPIINTDMSAVNLEERATRRLRDVGEPIDELQSGKGASAQLQERFYTHLRTFLAIGRISPLRVRSSRETPYLYGSGCRVAV